MRFPILDLPVLFNSKIETLMPIKENTILTGMRSVIAPINTIYNAVLPTTPRWVPDCDII